MEKNWRISHSNSFLKLSWPIIFYIQKFTFSPIKGLTRYFTLLGLSFLISKMRSLDQMTFEKVPQWGCQPYLLFASVPAWGSFFCLMSHSSGKPHAEVSVGPFGACRLDVLGVSAFLPQIHHARWILYEYWRPNQDFTRTKQNYVKIIIIF